MNYIFVFEWGKGNTTFISYVCRTHLDPGVKQKYAAAKNNVDKRQWLVQHCLDPGGCILNGTNIAEGSHTKFDVEPNM